MQFKIAKTHRYWWPVTVRLPDPENAGRLIEQRLKLEFEPLPRDEQVIINETAAQLKTAREIFDHEINNALRVVKDWTGVVDDAGKPVPFTEALFTSAMQQSWFRAGVTTALTESLNGDEARTGN